jgi:hypothetical protein
MKIANYVLKYTKSIDGPLMIPRKKIDSTMKWVEYSLDIVDMQKMLMGTRDLKDKYQLMDLLEIAERKKKWHYRQENFNVSRASTLLQTMLNSAYTKLP